MLSIRLLPLIKCNVFLCYERFQSSLSLSSFSVALSFVFKCVKRVMHLHVNVNAHIWIYHISARPRLDISKGFDRNLKFYDIIFYLNY